MELMVGCITNVNNNLLLLKHSDGKYSIPEDYVKEDELLKKACVRIMQEKTGINILPKAMFGVYDSSDRGYPKRTIGIYYVTYVNRETVVNKHIAEFNTNNKTKLDYELFLLSLSDVANQEYLYDHKIIINNYCRILMLASQSFKK